ncbi:protein phosphatase CheZ [Schlegelella sp. S2-27]|uniref:Protein phosphatase CheZ n=1 Tax=Caldimonas mangrovi TaxID=2944811 RepID=A0ABT0YKY8_9BURK|nr:protein phosphatase CheZ [Caldimonas mangrovi]MCM5679403.1 protein phosphatase CheZ [Caldimonas mangrovi]
MKPQNMPDTAPAATTSPEVYQQLGEMTRQLHDTLTQLGFMPRLGEITDSLPDARSRLTYIAEKTGEAAEKVLNLVDQAKAEQGRVAAETRRIAEAIVADPVKAVARGDVMNFVGDVDAATARIDQHLTDIMMAQDFHDLTGQVVAKVVKLAADIEDQLVSLLLKTAPPGHAPKVEQTFLNGPVVNPEGRTDVVANQEQVDDLLASLGF